MAITTKDDLFNVHTTQRPFFLENVGSAARAAVGRSAVCTRDRYMYMCGCTITKPDAARDHFPHTLHLRTDFHAAGKEGLRVGCESKSSKTSKAQRSAVHTHRTKATNAERPCSFFSLRMACRTNVRLDFPLAGETRVKIRSRTASISLEGER